MIVPKFRYSYEGQCCEVDRLYPALELRLILSAKLSAAASPPRAIRGLKIRENPQVESIFDFDDTWTPQPQNLEDDEIFMMSSHESSAESRAEDEESLYSDALSRKASVVSKFAYEWMNEWLFIFLFICLRNSKAQAIWYCLRIP